MSGWWDDVAVVGLVLVVVLAWVGYVELMLWRDGRAERAGVSAR